MSEKKPQRRITLQDEFHAHVATLVRKWERAGRRVPSAHERARVIIFIVASCDTDLTGLVRAVLTKPRDIVPGSRESATYLEVFARVFWRYPDFCVALMQKIRALDLGRDALDNWIATGKAMTAGPTEIADLMRSAGQRGVIKGTPVSFTADQIYRRIRRTSASANAHASELAGENVANLGPHARPRAHRQKPKKLS